MEDTEETILARQRIKLEKEKAAKKRIRKQRREIKRLKRMVELSMLRNNFDQYAYAMGKLRRIYMQPYTHELLIDQFITSREALLQAARKMGDENA